MTRNCCIVSLHFSPAHVSHMIAYQHLLVALGCSVDFVLHPNYAGFGEFAASESEVIASDDLTWDTAREYQLAIFYNAARDNHVHSARLRERGCKVWYVYHEPAESIRTYLQTESLLNTAKLLCAHYLSVKMLKAADGVLLSSERAVKAYRDHDYRYNSNYFQIPLLLDDESEGLRDQERLYFSYIGNITKAHRFDSFIQLIKFGLANYQDVHFLIASRRPLPPEVARDPAIAANRDRVTVKCGRALSNDEINRCYAQSICVWNLYRRSTQSGVLAKATMFGTPVLASSAGSFREFVTDGCEGRLLRDGSPQAVLRAYEDIRGHLDRYAAHARARFIRTFYWKSHLNTGSALFQSDFHGEEVLCH